MKHSNYPPGTEIDVYPVGVLDDLRFAYRAIRFGHCREAHRKIRSQARRIIELALAGEWRSVRQSFNGYLAEPTPFPGGLKGCGHGWTKKRALRKLDERMRTGR